MKNILLIGIGGTGSAAVDQLYRRIDDLGNRTGNRIAAITFSTENDQLRQSDRIVRLSLSDTADVGTICDRIGTQYLKDWFPCESEDADAWERKDPASASDRAGVFDQSDVASIRGQQSSRDSSLWRKNAYLSFLNLLNHTASRAAFHRAMEDLNQENPEATYDIYAIASIAGGTGSGAFLPITLYAHHYIKKYIGKIPRIHAFIACPDIVAYHHGTEMQSKFYANAYAFLRELNAINLVTTGYNRTEESHGMAPVRFRLGHPNEPLAGLLFDSTDPAFWNPDAAPFQKVFVFDKIPGVHSVEAHTDAIADTLYTVLCTNVGKTTDSELSNHVLLNAQSNGINAIYTVIATSKVQFPTESILTYLACKQTRSVCDNTWLLLHNRVHALQKENEVAAKERGEASPVDALSYARLYTETYREMCGEALSPLPMIVERTLLRDMDGDRSVDSAEEYFKQLRAYIMQTVECPIPKTISELAAIPQPHFVKDFFGFIKQKLSRRTHDDSTPLTAVAEKRSAKETFLKQADAVMKALCEAVVDRIDYVKKTHLPLTGAILSLADQEDLTASPVSLREKLLKCNYGGDEALFVHPVSQMVRICSLRTAIDDLLSAPEGMDLDKQWQTIASRFTESDLYNDTLRITHGDNMAPQKELRLNKSFYYKLGANRLTGIAAKEKTKQYRKKNTHVHTDSVCLKADATATFNRLLEQMGQYLCRLVFRELADRLDYLIDEYRTFFKSFTQACDDLEEKTRQAQSLDAGKVSSTVNIRAAEKEKDALWKAFSRENPTESFASVVANDNVVGAQVFRITMEAATKRYNGHIERTTSNAAESMRLLFDRMIESCKPLVRASETFQNISEMNILEAIIGDIPEKNPKQISNAISAALLPARESAKTSLVLDYSVHKDETSAPRPSDLTVLMMSYGTAQYIRKEATGFGIVTPQGATDETAIRSCAEQFARKYVSHNSRVAVVHDISDQILYITDEKLDIVPKRITKFNECNTAAYYHSYRRSLELMRSHASDRWNPHLGNSLHKPGRLPFLNPEMEKVQSHNTAKALLYAIFSKKIVCKKEPSQEDAYTFYLTVSHTDGTTMPSLSPMTVNGVTVMGDTLHLLFDWLREKDSLIDVWSAAFDRELKRQMTEIPPFTKGEHFERLEEVIQTCGYFKSLSNPFFDDHPDIHHLGAFADAVTAHVSLAAAARDRQALLDVGADIVRGFATYRTDTVGYDAMNLMLFDLFASIGHPDAAKYGLLAGQSPDAEKKPKAPDTPSATASEPGKPPTKRASDKSTKRNQAPKHESDKAKK